VWSHGAASVGGVQIGQALLPALGLKVIGGGIAGLAAGERVVVEGTGKIRPGAPVKPVLVAPAKP